MHEPIPTPDKLPHTLRGSERLTTLDMRHCFHQFEIEEKARKLFTFRTSWGLFRYTRMVMRNSPAPQNATGGSGQYCRDVKGWCR